MAPMTSALSLRSGYFPYLAAVLVLGTVLLYFLVVGNSLGLEKYHVVPVITPSDAIKFKDDHHIFPHLVHQMWKTKDSLTTDFKRWRSGCSRLNKEYAFHLYDDNDLKLFTHQHYPEYSALFDSLKGVYMADMARVLVTYHFGGIYMDLDFYCYRSFECLENYLFQQLLSKEKLLASSLSASNSSADFVTASKNLENKSHYSSAHILVVSREPEIHSRFIHGRERVVIQDFFFATPKHPFLRWFLDTVNRQFKEGRQAKGPFSYSIQGVLDEYYRQQKLLLASQTGSLLASRLHPASGSAPAVREYVLELPSDVLHPLLDSTNSKISAGCADQKAAKSLGFARQCRDFSAGKYLFYSADTMMVHMWTHSFLSFSFLRGWYEHSNYMSVEHTLPATSSCPIAP